MKAPSRRKMWLLLCLWAGFSSQLPAVSAQSLDLQGEPELRIRNYFLQVPNNSSNPYHFTLSVLGAEERGEFLPLLAIAVNKSDSGSDEWLAVWNLRDDSPGWLQRIKAGLPFPWSPRSGQPGDQELDDGSFPEPYLTWNEGKRGAWDRVRWDLTKRVAGFLNLFNPGRFFLHQYVHNGNDRKDRSFYQTYTLVQLYEEVASVRPSPSNLSAFGLTDLKYFLLINRHPLGILMGGESQHTVVDQYESELRGQMGKVAAYLHGEANFFHLGIEEVHYGLPGRTPVSRAAFLFIRKADLPETLPEWPSQNPFGLSYQPYRDSNVRRLIDLYPEEKIPLAFYVLASDFKVKPILVADFFRPANPRSKEYSGTVRLALDHYLAIQGLPFFYSALRRAAAFGLDRKDYAHFARRSTAAGLETARLLTGLGWNFDSDTNAMLLNFLEKRIANPLVESFERERINARAMFSALISEETGPLSLFLRRLYEDRIRAELRLNNRAVFRQDLERFREKERLNAALRVLRRFNQESHLSGYSWERLVSSFEVVRNEDPKGLLPESRRFLARMSVLYPHAVPDHHKLKVAQWLGLLETGIALLK